MDIYSSYSALNKSLLEVCYSTNRLSEVEMPKPPSYIRLVESPFVLSKKTKTVGQVVTAHDLSDYKNTFYSIKLENQTDNWLIPLLDIDKEEYQL